MRCVVHDSNYPKSSTSYILNSKYEGYAIKGFIYLYFVEHTKEQVFRGNDKIFF